MFGSRPDIAHWSTARELRKAGLFAEEGLICGRVYGRLLQDNGPAHALVIATTGAGKTTCFVYPNLLTWRQSALIFDPADEIYAATAGWRSRFSRVVQLCPTSSVSGRFNVLDTIPLQQDGEARAIQLLSDALTDPSGTGADRRSGTSEHFTAMARKAAQAHLLYGLYTHQARSLGASLALLVSRPFAQHLAAWSRYPHALIRDAAWSVGQAGEQNERGGIVTTLSRVFELYSDPLIQRATDTSDFTLRDLRERERPMSLYLSIAPRDQERLLPWTRLLLRTLLDYTVSRVEGWRWKFWAFLDEFQTMGRIFTIPALLGYARKFAVRLILITPSLEALVNSFGAHNPFWETCALKIVYGLEDTTVAEKVSHRLGETERTRWKDLGRGQRVQERVKERLLSSTALHNVLVKQRGVVVTGDQRVLVKKTYYKHHRTWNARSQLICGS